MTSNWISSRVCFRIEGTSSLDPEKQDDNMEAIYETIVKHIPSPTEDVDEPLQFLVTLMDYNEYLGRIAVGRVNRGKIRQGQTVAVMTVKAVQSKLESRSCFGFQGLKRIEIEEAGSRRYRCHCWYQRYQYR